MNSQLHALAVLSPGKEPSVPIGYEAEWPTAGLDAVERRKISFPFRESNRGRPARSPITELQNSALAIINTMLNLQDNHHWYLEKSGRWTKSENPIFL
jgi:hypothetical protein